MEVQEITLEEELRQKRRRLEGEGRKVEERVVEGKVHRLTRKELEQLVEAKVTCPAAASSILVACGLTCDMSDMS